MLPALGLDFISSRLTLRNFLWLHEIRIKYVMSKVDQHTLDLDSVVFVLFLLLHIPMFRIWEHIMKILVSRWQCLNLVIIIIFFVGAGLPNVLPSRHIWKSLLVLYAGFVLWAQTLPYHLSPKIFLFPIFFFKWIDVTAGLVIFLQLI